MDKYTKTLATGYSVNIIAGIMVFSGTAASAAAVYGEVGAVDAIGSIYISSVGGIYNQVANAGASTDWQKVTTT